MRTIQEGQTLVGPSFSEHVRVETARQDGEGTWTLGVVGTRSERLRRVVLTEAGLRQVLQDWGLEDLIATE